MTPPERAALAIIFKSIVQARSEPDEEFREAGLDQALAGIIGLLKRHPWQPKSGRYQLVDLPKVRGVELTADELSRLVELAGGPGDEELREKLKGL